MINKVDKNGTGQLEFKEFVDFFKETDQDLEKN